MEVICLKIEEIKVRFYLGILIGTGIGIFLILYLPLIAWLYIIAIALVIIGIKMLFD